MSGPAPRIVAELGRPETPEETAARNAENRRLRRSRQSTRNLVASLAVCLGIVAVIIALVPRGVPVDQPHVDYRVAASQAEDTAGLPLLAPGVPSSWRANAAELRRTGGVSSWYVGFVLPRNAFLAYTEGIRADPTWLSNTLESAPAGGTLRLGGLTWRVYDQRDRGAAAGNVAYALATTVGTTDLVVYGTAPTAQAQRLATALAKAAADRGLPGADTVPAP
jgi:Protein of unknown function (DUF4245)